MGLGLCLACVSEWKTEKATGAKPTRTPNYAIALAPTLVPLPAGVIAVAVGACLDHIPIGGGPPRGRGLLVPNGRS
jgi:hypothetical protein